MFESLVRPSLAARAVPSGLNSCLMWEIGCIEQFRLRALGLQRVLLAIGRGLGWNPSEIIYDSFTPSLGQDIAVDQGWGPKPGGGGKRGAGIR